MVFKIILIDFFKNIQKLCDNHTIINRSEVIDQILEYKIKINGNQIIDANIISHYAALVFMNKDGHGNSSLESKNKSSNDHHIITPADDVEDIDEVDMVDYQDLGEDFEDFTDIASDELKD